MSEDQIREEDDPAEERSSGPSEEKRFEAEREYDLERKVSNLETRIEYLATKSDIEEVKTVITMPLANHEGRIGAVERVQGYQWQVFGATFLGMLALAGMFALFMYFQFQETRALVQERLPRPGVAPPTSSSPSAEQQDPPTQQSPRS